MVAFRVDHTARPHVPSQDTAWRVRDDVADPARSDRRKRFADESAINAFKFSRWLGIFCSLFCITTPPSKYLSFSFIKK